MNKRFPGLWLLPFFAFATGYSLMHFFAGSQELNMPSIIGLPLEQALIILSEQDVSLRILDLKEDARVAPGTILSQSPAVKTNIKKRQTVYCIVAKQPTAQQTPHIIGKSKDDINTLLDHRGIHAKYYQLDADAPAQTCFAQRPLPGTALANPEMIIYLSSGKKKTVICPSYKGKSASNVIESLKKNSLTYTLEHTDPVEAGHTCDACMVVDQRPVPGSFITFGPNPPVIQLRISSVQ